MNFEIRRLGDMRFILRLFVLWVFIQILRDLISYSVLMTWFSDTLIYRIVRMTGYPNTVRTVFMSAVLLTLPCFIITAFNWRTFHNRLITKLAVIAMFVMTVMWLLLIPMGYTARGGGPWIAVVYTGNMLEVLVMASSLAWNMNQNLKYESDYGFLHRSHKPSPADQDT